VRKLQAALSLTDCCCYLLPKPPAPPALHTTRLLTTGGVELLLNGFLLQPTLAPGEALSIIVLMFMPQGLKGWAH
jgi:hypothetical protein